MSISTTCQQERTGTQRGFSLAELMVAMVVLLVVIGGVLQLLNQSQQRYSSTANVEDSTAMAREAVDLMARDIRLAGYPKPNSYPSGVIVPGTNGHFVATLGGFLAGSQYAVQFEADIGAPAGCGGAIPLTDYQCTSNTGIVSVIDYQLQVPSGGATGGCAGLTVEPSLTSPTLMRSQVPKNADGSVAVPVYVPYVSDVVNCTTSTSIFTYCGPVAAAGGCPDLSGQIPAPGGIVAPQNTRMVLIRLMVQTRNRDPQTLNFQIVEFYSVAEKANPEY